MSQAKYWRVVYFDEDTQEMYSTTDSPVSADTKEQAIQVIKHKHPKARIISVKEHIPEDTSDYDDSWYIFLEGNDIS